MNVAVSVKNLIKKYGDKTVVNNLTFQVREGEILGLLGPNGAGKTTTLECIEGIRSYDKGEIMIFSETASKEKFNQNIGVQLQSTSLQSGITVYEAMKLFCLWQNVPVRTDLLDTFGLKDHYKKQYQTMSTGQKRRLHLAIALATNPKLLILDEPTAGLDVEGRVQLHKEIRRLREEGVTIILASHDMAEVESLCDYIVIIVDGKLVIEGTPEEITASSQSDSKIIIKTESNQLKSYHLKHSHLISTSNDYYTLLSNDIESSLMEILQILKANHDKIIDLRVEKPSLEERFMEFVNEKEDV